MKTYYITNETVRAACARAVTELPLGYTVIFKEEDERRTAAQRGLYRVWLRSLSHQTGYTEDELHDRFKATFMLSIYLADQATPTQAEWIALYTKIKRDGTAAMVDWVLPLISTEWATIAQYREYLDRIEKFCISKGLQLPASSYYNEAMK